MKRICLLIACLIAILGCTPSKDDSQINKNSMSEINPYSFEESLLDDTFPQLYASNKENLIEYFTKIGRPEWLHYQYSDNEETSHYFIVEERQSIFYKKHIRSISITDRQDEYFSKLSLRESIEISEHFLPTTLPPIREDYSNYPHEKMVFHRTLENMYFLPGDESLGTVNEIIYTSKFKSDVHEPVLPEGREGAIPYYNAIRISIKDGGVDTISIGGMQYSPPRRQQSYKLNIETIDNYDVLLSIIEKGNKIEDFNNYIE